MKLIVAIGLAATALSGCTSGACDTGDSACKGGTNNTGSGPIVQGIFYDWTDNTVTWSVDTSGGQSGILELDLAETGDDPGGCQTDPNCENGFWTEHHDDFELVSSDGGNETKAITLTIVSTFEDFQQNSTTIMDVGVAQLESQLTYQVSAYDSAGNYFDCLAGGHQPGYWGCENTM